MCGGGDRLQAAAEAKKDAIMSCIKGMVCSERDGKNTEIFKLFVPDDWTIFKFCAQGGEDA